MGINIELAKRDFYHVYLGLVPGLNIRKGVSYIITLYTIAPLVLVYFL